jgi:hypothetical protein
MDGVHRAVTGQAGGEEGVMFGGDREGDVDVEGRVSLNLYAPARLS